MTPEFWAIIGVGVVLGFGINELHSQIKQDATYMHGLLEEIRDSVQYVPPISAPLTGEGFALSESEKIDRDMAIARADARSAELRAKMSGKNSP